MTMRPICCLAMFLICSVAAYALEVKGFEPDRTITYKRVGETELTLDVFLPPGHKSSDRRPAIVFFFGGGWNGGSPSQFYPHCQYLASRGMVAMSAEYRVKSRHETTPRECVKDGKSALRWIRRHAAELGIDPDKVAAGGGSAGGHVAAATATTKGFNEAGEDLSVSCRPNALVLFNPVYDNGPTGYGYDRVKDYWEEISPLHNIDKNTPPTVVFLGTQDKLIPVATAKKYKQLMADEGLRCDLHLYEGQAHGFFNLRNREYYNKTVIEADRFLASLGYLEGEPTVHAQSREEAYPFGPQLRVLAQDVVSPDYQEIVWGMFTTGLAAEWKRVATPDNYVSFTQEHGGLEQIRADAALKAAYENRKQVADGFVALMRQAYERKQTSPDFTSEQVRELLATARQERVASEIIEAVVIEPVLPAPGAERQWPCFRGPTGQGIALEPEFPLTWSRTENVLWKIELSGRGNSSPVIWDDRLFLTSASKDGKTRELFCFSRSRGKLQWQRAAPTPETIERIIRKNSYASSTPVTDGERVIAFFGNSGFVCYDMEGELQWKQHVGNFTTMHGPATSPVLYRDKIIFIQDQNRGESVFVALDKQTGAVLWQHDRREAMGWANPVIVRVADQDELIYNGSFHIKGYHPDTGRELWSLAGPTKEAIPTIVTGGGLIYSASGRNGAILALRPGGRGDITQTHLRWLHERGGPHVPSPAYHNGRLYLVSDTGVAMCLDATNGALIWQERLKGRFSMSPIVAGDKIILINEKGLAYILQAGDRLSILAQNDLGEETLATPAVLGGRIYIRTASHLYCIGES
ncbi:MAG: PQQ-binding-like beta-propeller repeat protein [Planctomycetes bacterium]|nr:PQQ-binding-like beta-propeller repeat protein [Planctomycetota bacterium]